MRLTALVLLPFAFALGAKAEICPRPSVGSEVTAPHEIRSQNGVLRVSLSFRRSLEPTGEVRYCYIDEQGNESPTLEVKPGDLLILRLKNDLPGISKPMLPGSHAAAPLCISGPMSAAATNLHFHGLMIPSTCHQDDVIRTSISPGAKYFEYRFRIPPSQPPGLYWYHPHPHSRSEEQVLGGASGALIVEGIEHFNSLVAGLPERLLIIRDQVRLSSKTPPVGPKPPSKDLSVNFIPVPYPQYPPAIVNTKPGQRELWRVLNASADTFLELHLLTNGKWQSMGLVSLDGVPLGYEENSVEEKNRIQWTLDIPIPPGGRAEFLYDSPPEGGRTQLLTARVDTAPFLDEDDPAMASQAAGSAQIPDDDDYTPPRWLLTVSATSDAAEPTAVIPKDFSPQKKTNIAPLKNIQPNRTRKLYFSEKILDAKNPRTSTAFYVTEEGHQPAVFDPAAGPNITVRQGEVEDWVIENRSQESHTFHIHQTHFVLLERDNKSVDENYLRDTVDVPYWDGVSSYPSVKLRIDFRDPATVGAFPYHCHILQHEDGGMMGTIRVLKASQKN
ncbi:MAG TPA: multicopper oxidase domain-containing protein [Candidatus Aquilonibacter sp.]|nr:multicopper oxidase domain-containing protein [Candidatus Aquilonibacter sp.]